MCYAQFIVSAQVRLLSHAFAGECYTILLQIYVLDKHINNVTYGEELGGMLNELV